MRFLRRSLTGLFLVCVTVALLAAAGYRVFGAFQERQSQAGFRPPARERQFAVNVIDVVPATLEPKLETFGQVLASRSLELRVPTGGRVVELADVFEDGGEVEAGEVLLRLDPTDADEALQVAEADYREAETDLADAERSLEIAGDDLAAAQAQLDLRVAALERQRNLSERGVTTSSEVETAALSEAAARQAVLSRRQALADATTAVDQARNGVLRADIARAEARRTIDDTELVAEFAGVLADVNVAAGSLAGANEQVATLVALDDLEVSFRISTEQYARLLDASGQLPNLPVRVSMDVADIDLSVPGMVTRESAVVGEGQSGRLLYAKLESANGLRPGDFVRVTITEPSLDNVALLPASAVDAAGKVLVVSDDMRLEVAPAPVLRRQGDDVIVNASAIDGARVVEARSPLLGAGIRVTINGGDESSETADQTGGDETVRLSEEKRAALIAFVDGNTRMPAEARERIKEQLAAEEVSAELVASLESRMGS